jgi:hypothetical protein
MTIVNAPPRRLKPTPKRSDKDKDRLTTKYSVMGTTKIVEIKTSKLARIAVLTYALKLVFIPDFFKLESRSVNNGRALLILSPSS